MENTDAIHQPFFLHAEPVLAVRDVSETVSYWHETLGFPDKWMWGDPPNHGGVSWNGAGFVQFSLNPKVAAKAEGHCVWMRVRRLEPLYALHQEKKVAIVSPPEKKPWGFVEYTIKDINGYYIQFAAPFAGTEQHEEKFPSGVRITARKPTVSEHKHLAASVGWPNSGDHNKIASLLESARFAAVAEDTQTAETIGCALLFGDNVAFYYVKDVIVHPRWQRKGIGTMLMQELTRWLEAHAPDHATVGLFTGEHLASFYRRFGFAQACGMYREIL